MTTLPKAIPRFPVNFQSNYCAYKLWRKNTANHIASWEQAVSFVRSIAAFFVFLSMHSFCNLTDLFFFLSLASAFEECGHASETTLTAFRRCSFFWMRCLFLFSVKKQYVPLFSFEVFAMMTAVCVLCFCRKVNFSMLSSRRTLTHSSFSGGFTGNKKGNNSKFQWYFVRCIPYF